MNSAGETPEPPLFDAAFTRWLLVLLGVYGLAIAAIAGAGALLPEVQTCTFVQVIHAPADRIWKVLTDFEHAERWFEKVQQAQYLPPGPGGIRRWRARMADSGTTALWDVAEERPPSHLRLRLANVEDFATRFELSVDLIPEGNGTRLVLMTRNEVGNPFVRSLARIAYDPEGETRRMARALKRLAEQP